MPPDARVSAFLDRARRRGRAAYGARVIAIALAAGALWLGVRVIAGARAVEIGLTAAIVVIAAVAAAWWRTRGISAAGLVERRTDVFHNALVTSEQLLRDPRRANADIRALVLDDTAERASRVDLPSILPARVPVALAATALIGFVGILAFGLARATNAAESTAGRLTMRDGPMAISAIEITVVPPGYSGRKTETFDNPERIEALEGSRVAVRVSANSQVEHVEFAAGGPVTTLRVEGGGKYAGEFVAHSQTFISLMPRGIAPGVPVMIGMTVTPDRAPDVRIAEPGRDMFLPAANRDIPVRVTARDDFGVTSLTLAYTKVSGSGETFQFVEGTLPLALTLQSGRDVAGSGVFRPSAMGLSPGDLLVYRAIARDAHPSRGPAESDTFVIEIVSASEAMAEGFSIDDQRDAYAISQQMVILKTERLIASRGGLTPQAVVEQAALIAAEQRRVRAEFVFMMGGEVEDEEVEAEQSHEIEAGREQNEGRRDLISAIRSMSDAAALLVRPDIDQALAAEKRALASLQRALTRSRYILRVLAARERIDDTRRLSGDRTGAADWRRDPAATSADPEAEAMRDALARLSPLARRDSYDDGDRAVFAAIAQRLLSVRGAGAQAAAQALIRASRGRDANTIAPLVDEAALAIDAALESRARAHTAAPPAAVSPRVRGALADRLRAAGRAGGGR